MKQLDKEQMVARFLAKTVTDYDEKKDASTKILFAALLNEVKEDNPDRTVNISVDSDDSFEAYSRKLSNLLQLTDPSHWMKIIKEFGKTALEIVGVQSVLNVSEGVKLGMAILGFLSIMYKETKVVFNEQDARILFAIASFDKSFSMENLKSKIDDLNTQYNGKFNFTDDLLLGTIEKLVKYQVLGKDTRDDIYVVKEKIHEK